MIVERQVENKEYKVIEVDWRTGQPGRRSQGKTKTEMNNSCRHRRRGDQESRHRKKWMIICRYTWNSRIGAPNVSWEPVGYANIDKELETTRCQGVL